jgi:hypothetical protein
VVRAVVLGLVEPDDPGEVAGAGAGEQVRDLAAAAPTATPRGGLGTLGD